VPGSSELVTFLFTDVEGSTRLWDQHPERMRPAMARHDRIARDSVEQNRGSVVKMVGDGVHAVFDSAADAVAAAVEMQLALSELESPEIALRVRCGLHAGSDERRDNDFYGVAVNRAARIMSAAHGGQILISDTVASFVQDALPADVSLRDLGFVRLRDLTSPERLHQVLHPRLRADFPALRSLEATPNNLPQQLTSFIGRERELSEVTRLLAGTRLLSLLGIGGLGKSRLSVQVAAEVMDDYPDGVWFVELAPVADARLVPHAVASVMSVKEDAGRPVVEALLRHVKDRRLLIVLDNCEHVVQACAELAKQLLQGGAGIRILASSREHLNIAGETVYPLAPLAVPDRKRKLSLDELTRYEAVRLFAERASAAQPSFRITDANAEPVSDICQRLDGIPLAIELATARVRTLSVDKIAARLIDRFRLLSGGDRTLLPRQQTLRALIDWSYDLLSDNERALFRRLSVFAGGFTLEAAEAVGPGGDIEEADILDLLTDLVDKSLVMVESSGDRYRLLDTVRQYAQERLDATDEGDATNTRHLAFYLELAEKAGEKMRGPLQGAWLANLDLERENLLAAHAWCDHAEDGGELGLRLVYALRPYFFNRGLLGLRHGLTLEALARPGAAERTLARCRGLFDAGQICCFMGRYFEAQSYLEESLAIARELGDEHRIVEVLQPLAFAALGRNHPAAARRHLEEGVALARKLGDRRQLAAAINGLAQLHRSEGELDAAEPLFETVVSLSRAHGDREGTAIGLLNIAMVAIGRNAHDHAHATLREALSIAEETGSRPAGQSVLEVCAALLASRGDWARAARFYGVAEAQMVDTGLTRDPTDEAFLAPLIDNARMILGVDEFAAAEAGGRSLDYDAAITEARALLASDT
jgi:predicted ATPase/class 3 adenylate cyclase